LFLPASAKLNRFKFVPRPETKAPIRFWGAIDDNLKIGFVKKISLIY